MKHSLYEQRLSKVHIRCINPSHVHLGMINPRDLADLVHLLQIRGRPSLVGSGKPYLTPVSSRRVWSSEPTGERRIYKIPTYIGGKLSRFMFQVNNNLPNDKPLCKNTGPLSTSNCNSIQIRGRYLRFVMVV